MANFEDAFKQCVSFESTDVQGTKPARTRLGVRESSHPDLVYGTFFTSMPVELATNVARASMSSLWRFDGIKSQVIATKLFDLCVTAGYTQALTLMREALQSCGRFVAAAQWGPNMLAATNTTGEKQLSSALSKGALAYYEGEARLQKLNEVPSNRIERANWGNGE